MGDFPTLLHHPNHIAVGSCDNTTLCGQLGITTNGVIGTSVWQTANKALYIPFMVEVPFAAKSAGVRVAAQSGNLDVGVYDEFGTALVTKGSTAVGAGPLQAIDLSASISKGTASPILTPGTYYFAMNCDNITASFYRVGNISIANLRVCGVREQAVGAVALPAVATFAVLTVTHCPLFLLSGTAIL